MAYPTFSDLRQRVAYLRGETDYTTTNATIDSHINAAIRDIVLAFPFSWDVAKTTISLTAGTANLPADFIPKWGLDDARIVGSGSGDDFIFTPIPFQDRDSYDSSSYVYWITYDTANKVYVFNSPTLTGTVTIYYHFFPATLTASSDTVAQTLTPVVPDIEAIAYLATSKNWVGDERNQSLSADYLREASARISALQVADLQFGAQNFQGSVVDSNSDTLGGGFNDSYGLPLSKPY